MWCTGFDIFNADAQENVVLCRYIAVHGAGSD